MSKILGFIGAGNMGKAMIGGILDSEIFLPQNIMVSDLNESALRTLSEKYGVKTTTKNSELAKLADIIILSIKPNLYPIVIAEIRETVKKDVIIVTIAAGKLLENTQKAFEKEIKVVRVMPNTPAMVGEGMAAISPNDLVTKDEVDEIVAIFESFGKAEIVNEKLMDVVTSVSGSGPAYIYMFIEAMADAAVLNGMPRDIAYKFVAQTVIGSGKMVLETGKHPGELKDMVCSPGGTTIEAVSVLEKTGMRSSVIEAIKACYDKSVEMSK